MANCQLRILIVEDDLSFALELEMLVQEIGYELAGRVDNSSDAMSIIYGNPPDIILMDIDIKGNLTGIQLGESIKDTGIPIIFITSFDDEQHYEAAKKTNIVGYLVKPANKFSLRTTINLAMKKLAQHNPVETTKEEETSSVKDDENVIFKDAMFLKKQKVYYRIDIKDIQCIEADGNYSNIYVGDQKFYSKFKLSYLEGLLPDDKFMRTHRGHILNLDFFKSINMEENTLKTQNGQTVLLSRSKRQDFLQRMKLG